MGRGRPREFDIDDVYRAIWERQNVFLVARNDLLDYYQRYVRLHYATDLAFRVTLKQSV